MGSIRRARELSDIAPQYITKSGLCSASEFESTKWGSVRIQHVTGLTNVPEGKSRFPKLDECAHFHYEHVEIGPLQVSIVDDDNRKPLTNETDEEKWWSLNVQSQNKTWLIRRSYENFRMFDQQLHRCIYDRKFSELTEIPEDRIGDQENIHKLLANYMRRFSVIAGNIINCGPILNWLELDNRGHRLLVPDNDNCPINTPAVAAAYSVKRYAAQAPDEISFEVGDMISVIDMPPPEESIWWHGKRGFHVGFFPCECVAVIGDKVPRNLHFSPQTSLPTKPVLRKHGKLIAFFRSFILSRPSRRRLKQSGILRERVFGCDLGEHLLNSGHEIPMVLKCCVEFIESHGLVDGIYRLSGITSNIQKLRNAFDEDRVPGLYEDEAILQDVHSVASLLKMYFRELPNPLCTYQLYHQFVGAVQATQGEDTRLLKMRDVVQKLPPPHYRTLEYLMRHLARVSEKGHETGMTSRNVAIVWAPNLLRCKELEVGGVAALQGVGVQAVVTEFLVCYSDLIFCDRLPNFSLPPQQVCTKKCRPKSLAISTPTKLLSLEEARTRALLQAAGKTEPDYIEVGGGPANLPAKYHTVIELPGYSRKRTGSKRSPLGWKMLFGKSGRSSQSRKELESKITTPSDVAIITGKVMTESDLARSRRPLRPAKSAESLNSSRNSEMVDVVEVSIAGGIEDCLSPMLLRSCEGKGNGHNRSVSHESYFDQLQDEKSNLALDISEIQVNFDLEESEMRIFSEDETIMSNGSGSLASNTSPRILPPQKMGKLLGNSVKRLSHPKLSNIENDFDKLQNTDPSPKKQKTHDENPIRSKLEEQLSSSVGEIQFIDSVSPDQTLPQSDTHLIQSPSPVSSISQLSSSLLAPSSPILPHIPHLMKHFLETTDSHNAPGGRKSLILDRQFVENSDKEFNSKNSFSKARSSSPNLIIDRDITSCGRNVNVVETTISDRESSDLTTPETPICSTYTPLVEFEESSLSDKTTPDIDVGICVEKSLTDSLDKSLMKSCSEPDNCKNVQEVEKFDNTITNVNYEIKGVKSHYELISSEMVKVDTLKNAEEIYPKPVERKPKPIHPYVNIPIVDPEIKSPRVLETSFDVEPTTTHRNTNFSIKYQGISTESSSDSLVNDNKVDDNDDGDDGVLFLNLQCNRESSSPQHADLNASTEKRVVRSSTDANSDEEEKKGCTVNLFASDEIDQQLPTFEQSLESNTDQLLGSSWSTSTHNQGESEELMNHVKSENSVDCDFEIKYERELPVKFECFENVTAEPMETKLRDITKTVGPSFESEPFRDEARSQNEIQQNTGEMGGQCVIEKESISGADGFTPSGTTQTNQWKEGLLETDLDAPDFRFTATLEKVNERSLEKNEPGPDEPSGNVRQLLSKFELSPTSEKNFVELKMTCDDSRSEGVKGFGASYEHGTRSFREEVTERPKTLERLSTRRKMVESSEFSKLKLGKSKSGSHINDQSPDGEKVDVLLSCDFDLSDPQRRERIEKYKEKRRNYLREKYRSDSFKNDKDDFVLKIKQKHLRKGDREDGNDGKGSPSEMLFGERWSDPSSGRNSPQKKDKSSGQKLWKAKEAGCKTFSADGSGRSSCDRPTTPNAQSIKKNSFVSLSGERRTTVTELKSSRSSPEKKNNFLSFSIGGLTNEDDQPQQSRPKKSPRSFMESKSSCDGANPTVLEVNDDFTKPTMNSSKSESSPLPVPCIKDMAALFEGRNDGNAAAKQYLSSV